MLRRNTRRRRSRTRPRATELTVENVIEIWKSETFQKEHGDSREKIEKIISKWKNEVGEASKEKTKDIENEQPDTIPEKSNTDRISLKNESQEVETEDVDCIKYKCDHCEYATKSKAFLKRHMLEKHLV